MLHERLFERLKSQQRNLRSGKYIEALGKDAKNLLQMNAPSLTGTLIKNLGTTSGIHETRRGFQVGYGRREKVGLSSIGAPRGTIAAFLKDYPQFRRNWSWVKSVGGYWKALPIEGREQLQAEREMGNYGGGRQGVGVGMSAYLYQQEGTFSNWRQSAQAASITPLHFIDIALTEWRAYSLPRAMQLFASDFGLKHA